MKIKTLWVVTTWLVLTAVVLAACSSATPTVTTDSATPAVYPSPETEESLSGESAYPAPAGEGTAIPWAQAQNMLLNELVVSVVQNADLTVSLTATDGTVYLTTLPAADALQKAIEFCGEPCAAITVTNQ